jgi:hypothetical protein
MVGTLFLGDILGVRHYNLRHPEESMERSLELDRNMYNFMQWRRQMIKYIIPDTFCVAERSRLLIRDYHTGRIDERVTRRIADQQIAELGDLLDELSERKTPGGFKQETLALARSHGDLYISLCELKKGRVQEAWLAWGRGYRNATIARQGIRWEPYPFP